MNISIISAGAGSGKTYRLTQDMARYLNPKNGYEVRAEGIFATTFTNKAAAELQDRVRVKLLEDGLTEQADALGSAMIGTVHSLGVKLLRRFAFEAGVSPKADILAEDDKRTFFNQALSSMLTTEIIGQINQLAERLSIEEDWRTHVQTLCDAARSNNFTIDDLTDSCQKSLDSFMEFLPEKSKKTGAEIDKKLLETIKTTIDTLSDNDADSTKATADVVNELRKILFDARSRPLNWSEWAKISKLKVGKKSDDLMLPLQEVANLVESHPDFQQNIIDFTNHIFNLAKAAISEYQRFKTERGLIDYTDMEVSILALLKNNTVCEVLRDELDLLLVDEFQDTNPIQLAIFLKLSEFAKIAVWVGDPKQSIYGFRGSDPQLMEAVMVYLGGVLPENILGNSWRSRADLVNATNAIFCKALVDLPNEQIALDPVRRKSPQDCAKPYHQHDHLHLEGGIWHWHFKCEEAKGQHPPGWLANCVADRIRATLQGEIKVAAGSGKARNIIPSDIAVLCRTNSECQQVAEALEKQGIRSAIARVGLLETPEIKLVLACLKYILQRHDTVSVAEMMRLGMAFNIEQIIEHRLDFLDKQDDGTNESAWAADFDFMKKLAELRKKATELSSYEILNIVLEELDLRRIVAAWGNTSQRLNNVDALRKIVVEYESSCNRLQTAASLGGALLYLSGLANDKRDAQGLGDSANAVQILTYHASKGLEWAMTVCMNLEIGLRDKIWGVNIVNEREIFDIKDPLGGRWLRYWQNPYGQQIGKTQLENAIGVSPAKELATAQALAEDARLLYVGLTRARDYLVLPTREKKPTKWLNRVWHNGKEELPTLSINDGFTPFEWNNEQIAQRLEVHTLPKTFGAIEPPIDHILFRAPRAGKVFHDNFMVDVSKSLPKKPQIQNKIRIAESILLPDEIDHELFAQAAYYFLQFDNLNYKKETRTTTASLLLAPIFDDLDELEKFTGELMRQSECFYISINAIEKNRICEKNVPVHDLVGNMRCYNGIIDVLATAPKTTAIIKHSLTTNLSESHINSVAESHATELYFQRSAVAAMHNRSLQEVQIFVYFPIAGLLVELR